MGSSGLLTVYEAARLIDVSPSTIRRLTHEGCLHPRYERRGGVLQPAYDPNELAAYQEARCSPWDTRRRSLVGLTTQAGLRSLERRVQHLESVLGARLSPPPLDAETMVALYNSAADDLVTLPTDEDTVMRWARFFLGVGEEYFDLLEAITEDEEAWKLFMDLGQELMKVAPQERFELEPSLRIAYGYLESGRRNLRNVLFMHLRARMGGRAAQRLVGGPADVHEEILNILANDA